MSQIDAGALVPEEKYPGEYEGTELTCDSRGNVSNLAGLYARDTSGSVYPGSGVRDGFHTASHHSNARARMDTPEIRDRLHDFAAQMRTDETVVIPMGEGNLASPSTWRRQLKRRIWRVMRPATWRYDRLLGDHAELTTSLAEKVMVLEAEVDRLKAERDGDSARGENAP